MASVTASDLAAVLDCLIPADPERGLPAAGSLVTDTVRERLGDALAALAPGFAALEASARAAGAERFAALEPTARADVLRAHAERDAGFVPPLVFHTYAAYYQQPAVLEALGMEGRPPHPKGYELEPGDLTLLDPVRARPPLYRRV